MSGNGSRPLPTPGADEGELHLRDLVNLVRRNLALVVGIAGTVIAGTVWFTWTTAPVYEARTTIHVDQERSVLPDLELLSNVLRGGDVETEIALVRARSIAAATVDSLSLHARLLKPTGTSRSELFTELRASALTDSDVFTFRRVGERYQITDGRDRQVAVVAPGEATVFNGMRVILDPEPAGGLRDEVVLHVSDAYEAVQELMERLTVGRPFRDASLIAVTYQGTDPELVARVPDQIAQEFIQQRIASKKTEAVSTVNFLSAQIDNYTQLLVEAENNLLAFQQGEQVVNLEAEGAQQVARLVQLQAERDNRDAELTSLSSILESIDLQQANRRADESSPFRRLAGFGTFLTNQAVTQLLTDLSDTEALLTAERERRELTHPDVVALTRQIENLEVRLHSLAVSYQENLTSEISSLNGRLQEFGAQLERIPLKGVQEERLRRQKLGVEAIFNQLQSRLKEAEIAQAVEPGDVRVVDRAVLPRDPIRPRKMRSLLLSLLFGLTLGLGVAAARDYMDETIHTREDLGRITGLPVLALIPRIRGTNGNGRRFMGRERPVRERLVTRDDTSSPVSEAYRAFRTNITFLDLDTPARVLVFTSPGPSEGKSTSAANLAITLAQQNTRAILVDCDLRRGIVHRVFDAPKVPGLTNILLGEVKLDEAVHQVSMGEGRALDFLSTGTLPPNPSELLGSGKMRQLIGELRARYELVLIDSPPLNVVTDAAVLGTLADGVVLIARAGSTARDALRYARDQLEAVRAPVSGAVLNDVDLSGRDRYYGSGAGYRYQYKYSQQND